MKIIAELCQNHNGDSKILYKMVEEAKNNGATHVKIQHILANNLSQRSIFEKGLIEKRNIISIKRPYKDEYKRLKRLELNNNTIKKFVDYCNKLKIVPITTCFTRGDVDQIYNLGFKEIKVASYDCAPFQMIRELKERFKHIYVSTGSTYNSEVKKTASILKKNFTFLHCVTQYPTKLKNVNLNRMSYLKKFTKNFGYSDHTSTLNGNIDACFAAIYLGANVIERHFTILPKNKTRDGIVSINPIELNELSKFSKKNKNLQQKIIKNNKINIKLLSGKINTKMTKEELLNREYYRGRFVTKMNDKRGKLSIYNWEETPI